MGAEAAICSFEGGLGVASMIALVAIALGVFAVFGDKFSKKGNRVEVSPLET